MKLYVNEYKIFKLFFKKKNKYVFVFFSLCVILSYKYEDFCLNCINQNEKNRCFICSICSNIIIFGGIKIYNEDETLNEIINKNKSIARYGDGEFLLILGEKIGFQEYDPNLARRLLKILNIREKNLLIGINLPYKIKILNSFIEVTKKYYRSLFRKYKYKFSKFLLNKEYYSSRITRFYIDLKSKSNVPKYIKKLEKIWDKKDILIIEGNKSRLGIGNNLFDNSNSIQRIICPSINAFKSL